MEMLNLAYIADSLGTSCVVLFHQLELRYTQLLDDLLGRDVLACFIRRSQLITFDVPAEGLLPCKQC